jgi:hypothetical protein
MTDLTAEKPKNEFDKYTPNPTNGVYRERGGCLTLFLVVHIVINAISTYNLVRDLPRYLGMSSSTSISDFFSLIPLMPPLGLLVILHVVLTPLSLICTIGMWRWKKWGYYGLGLFYLIDIIVLLLWGNIFGVVAGALSLAILNAVYTPRIEMFE